MNTATDGDSVQNTIHYRKKEGDRWRALSLLQARSPLPQQRQKRYSLQAKSEGALCRSIEMDCDVTPTRLQFRIGSAATTALFFWMHLDDCHQHGGRCTTKCKCDSCTALRPSSVESKQLVAAAARRIHCRRSINVAL